MTNYCNVCNYTSAQCVITLGSSWWPILAQKQLQLPFLALCNLCHNVLRVSRAARCLKWQERLHRACKGTVRVQAQRVQYRPFTSKLALWPLIKRLGGLTAVSNDAQSIVDTSNSKLGPKMGRFHACGAPLACNDVRALLV